MVLTHACGAMRSREADWSSIAEALEQKAQECRMIAAGGCSDTLPTSPWFASRIVQDWHRLPQFVDEAGEPRALKLWGATESVEAIANLSCESPAMAKAAVRALKSLGGCRQARRGRYVPVSYGVMLSKSPAVVDKHAECVLACMIETIESNKLEKNAETRDFERSVHSERLDAHHLPAFRHFMQAQGMSMLEVVDQWLEDRQVNVGQPGVEVVVELFSHVTTGEAKQVAGAVTSPNKRKAGVPEAPALLRENNRRVPRPRGVQAVRGEAR